MSEVNPLLNAFDEAPFSKIKDEHFKPAFLAALGEARKEIEEITKNDQPPSYENTIEALEFCGQHLDRISSLFFNLNAADTNETLQVLAQEISPMLSEFSNDITLNSELYERVKTVYESRKKLDLNPEQETLLEKKFRHFTRNGANLSDDDKKRLREIDSALATRKLSFGENVLAETNKYEMHIQDAAQLDGLPEGVVEAARQLAETRNKEGWVFTLDYPSYLPFMKYARNRELRKEIYLAFASKGFHGDELDNTGLVLEIANLRFERAQLLGYQSHAHFVLEERMADTPEKVLDFLKELLEKAKPAAMKEFEQLQDFAKETDGIEALQKWDAAYYSEKLKQKLFELDDEQLKPYFKLENVLDGVFRVTEKLFGLRFEAVDDVDKYHE
ncbi:MAG: M3 family metallopeptidase, partial [Eudoraea sp.]|nr:M3 family metallopeptidase [Eudoraea sp.]